MIFTASHPKKAIEGAVVLDRHLWGLVEGGSSRPIRFGPRSRPPQRSGADIAQFGGPERTKMGHFDRVTCLQNDAGTKRLLLSSGISDKNAPKFPRSF